MPTKMKIRRFLTVVLLALPAGLDAQSPDTIPSGSWLAPLHSIGSPLEDRSRLAQLLGADSAAGFLLRSPSSRM
ncbi:MAG: hypothetical protein M3483_08220, partial [Gemmatimonadota bacterium]|nr:hypothetical protein [Gemmatimonadota bacterium]